VVHLKSGLGSYKKKEKGRKKEARKEKVVFLLIGMGQATNQYKSIFSRFNGNERIALKFESSENEAESNSKTSSEL